MTNEGSVRIRPYRDDKDFVGQYGVWLRATERLPFAWSSSLVNTRGFAGHVPTLPNARLFAERDDGEIVGYIGVNEVMPWDGIGQALPFGYPWTCPVDDALASELYESWCSRCQRCFPASESTRSFSCRGQVATANRTSLVRC